MTEGRGGTAAHSETEARAQPGPPPAAHRPFLVDNAPEHHKAARWWTLLAGAAWVSFFLLTLAFPKQPDGGSVTLQLLSVAIGIVVLCGLLIASQRPFWSVFARTFMFLAGVLVVTGLYALNLHSGIVPAFTALALMVIALPLGYWIGEKMERATHLIPLALTMSMADIYSVAQGPTKKIAEDLVAHQEKVAEVTRQAGQAVASELRTPLADYIIVHLPLAGSGQSSPVLGMGDFIILAFLFRAAWVHHIHPGKVFAASVLSVFVALCAALLLNKPLPALPFIGIGTIGLLLITEPRMRRLNRMEVVCSIIGVGVFLVLLLVKLFPGGQG
ncbi:hypothetical protein IT575_11675 [bacterium]|nr:hypothetical protein [bacterium]